MAKREGCPICGGAPTQGYKPFCGRGCKDRDLLQWLGEGYRVPGEAADPDALTRLDTGQDRD